MVPCWLSPWLTGLLVPWGTAELEDEDDERLDVVDDSGAVEVLWTVTVDVVRVEE